MHVWNIHEVTTADVSRAIHTVWCCTWEHKIATSQTSRLLFTKRKWQRNWWRKKRLEEKKESMKQAIKMIFILLAKKPWLPLPSMTSLLEKDMKTHQAGAEAKAQQWRALQAPRDQHHDVTRGEGCVPHPRQQGAGFNSMQTRKTCFQSWFIHPEVYKSH